MQPGSSYQENSFGFLKKTSDRLHACTCGYAIKRPFNYGMFVVLVAVVIGFFSRFPSYTGHDLDFPGSLSQFSQTRYGQAIDWWLQHPFQHVPTEQIFGPGSDNNPAFKALVSHCEKLTFRAFLPMLGCITHKGLFTLVAANHLAALLTFALAYIICLRSTSNPLIATATTWAYAACWSGSWGFNDFIYGDAVGMALLLLALVTSRFLPAVLFIFCACLTDERAICTAPLIILFRYWQLQPPFAETNSSPALKLLRQAGLPVVVGLAAYAAVRLYMSLRLGIAAGTSMMGTRQILTYNLYVDYPGTFFKVFEFLWFAPVLLILNLGFWTKVHRSNLPAYLICMLLAAAPSLLVWDFDRSVFYLWPAVLASICFAPGTIQERMQISLVLFAACFFWLNPLESWLHFLI